MIYEELKTGFRIYDDIEKQDRNLKSEDGPGFDLISPTNALLPFQFRIPGNVTLTSWKIFNQYGEDAFDITDDLSLIAKSHVEDSDGVEWSYFLYPGGTISEIMPEGYYYTELVDSAGKHYYSEIFFVPCAFDPDNYMTITWSHSCDLADLILYQTGWENVIYLDTEVSKEKPVLEEEGTEDGYGEFIPAYQRLVQNLYMEAIVPYNIAEALTVASMHDTVTIRTKKGTYEGQIKGIKSAVAQQEGSWKYLFSMTFQQETKYLVTSCCNNMTLI